MFPPFAGITYPCVTSPLATRIAASCFVLHLIALLFIVFPLRYFFPVDFETAADVRVFDYIEDDPSYCNISPPVHLSENAKPREYLPGCFPPSPVSPHTALEHV